MAAAGRDIRDGSYACNRWNIIPPRIAAVGHTKRRCAVQDSQPANGWRFRSHDLEIGDRTRPQPMARMLEFARGVQNRSG